jgi:hypothetical protein
MGDLNAALIVGLEICNGVAEMAQRNTSPVCRNSVMFGACKVLRPAEDSGT